MAPALYFQYLAERRPSLMQGLFIHNEHDILSLASLAVHFSLALSGRLAYAAMEAEELFRIGVWLDKMGKSPFAEEAFTHLLARPSASASSHWLALAAFYKKKGAELKAVQLWSQYIALERNELSFVPAEPYIELAMFFEHRKKDYATALDHAQKAYEQARRQASFLRLSIGRSNSNHKPSKQQELCDQLLKRIERLRKKIANSVTKLQF
jgi:tetratricopeptide (TPR) repeat protein